MCFYNLKRIYYILHLISQHFNDDLHNRNKKANPFGLAMITSLISKNLFEPGFDIFSCSNQRRITIFSRLWISPFEDVAAPLLTNQPPLIGRLTPIKSQPIF